MPTIGIVSWGEPLNVIKMSFQSLTTNTLEWYIMPSSTLQLFCTILLQRLRKDKPQNENRFLEMSLPQENKHCHGPTRLVLQTHLDHTMNQVLLGSIFTPPHPLTRTKPSALHSEIPEWSLQPKQRRLECEPRIKSFLCKF